LTVWAWPPRDLELGISTTARLDEFTAFAGRAIIDRTRGMAPGRLAALCIEGEEVPGAVHLLPESDRSALLRSGAPRHALWSPYRTWDGDPYPIDDAFTDDDERTIADLQRELEPIVPMVMPSLHLYARVGRWITAAAPDELLVTEDFVAYALPADFGVEVWQSLWLSSPPETWARLLAQDLVPARLEDG
jgi:hypothetical protein